jgi:peptidoglycan pentaglycine glycine transferase (the first glycine)
MSILNSHEWDNFLKQNPNAHVLQTSAWGTLKSSFGWSVVRLMAGHTGAQILFRHLPFGFTIAYIAKGPVGSSWDNLWDKVDQLCRKKRSVFALVEPDLLEPLDDAHMTALSLFGQSSDSIQPRRSILLDLSGTQEQVLGRMKQKTRYNIHLAERKGVKVHQSEDLSIFYRMMQATGIRDGFSIHSLEYYQQAYRLFHTGNNCILLQADYQDLPLAAVMVFAQGERAWYFYGASSDEERNRMPTYLLQWHAMQWAMERGCLQYDLWGIPDADEGILEESFTSRQDDLWGVYRFKRGFGGQIVRSAGAFIRVYNPLLFRVYSFIRRGKSVNG